MHNNMHLNEHLSSNYYHIFLLHLK